jgi:hypothetical protein
MDSKTDQKIHDLLQAAREEEQFALSPAFEIADYFRNVLKKHMYTVSEKNWKATKEAARLIILDHSHIPISEWKKCVDWCFSPEKKKDTFWGVVPINTLHTVIKIFNTYREAQAQTPAATGTKLQYGKIKKP